MADTRWDLIGLAGLGALGGIAQSRANAAAAGAIQRTGIISSVETARQAKRVEGLIPAIRLQAEQQHNQIISEYRDWAAVADSVASYMGRDDRSVDAIRKRIQSDTSETLSRARTQALSEEAKVAREAASLTANAINQRMSADAQANIQMKQGRASTLATGLSLFASMI